MVSLGPSSSKSTSVSWGKAHQMEFPTTFFAIHTYERRRGTMEEEPQHAEVVFAQRMHSSLLGRLSSSFLVGDLFSPWWTSVQLLSSKLLDCRARDSSRRTSYLWNLLSFVFPTLETLLGLSTAAVLLFALVSAEGRLPLQEFCFGMLLHPVGAPGSPLHYWEHFACSGVHLPQQTCLILQSTLKRLVLFSALSPQRAASFGPSSSPLEHDGMTLFSCAFPRSRSHLPKSRNKWTWRTWARAATRTCTVEATTDHDLLKTSFCEDAPSW